GVDGFFELQNFAADVYGDLLRQVAVRDGDRHVRDVADLGRQVAGHLVHGFGEIFPNAGHALHLCLTAELAFGADLARHARHFGREDGELLDHAVHELGGPQELAFERPAVDLEAHRLAEITLRDRADGACHFGGG